MPLVVIELVGAISPTIATAQNIRLWVDADNRLRVTMDPAVDLTSWTLELEIWEIDTVTLLTTKTITKENAVTGIFLRGCFLRYRSHSRW